MKLNQIITSLLETDLYKFSMGQTIYHQFTSYKTTWTFKCRNQDVFFTPEMVEEIKEQISSTEWKMDYIKYRSLRKDGTVGYINDFGHLEDGLGEGNQYFQVFLLDVTEQI